MSNYRRFSSYRQHSQSGHRLVKVVTWGVIIVVCVILVKNVLWGGSGSGDDDADVEVSLANNTNAGVVTSGTRDLAVSDCTQPISSVTTGQPYVSLTLDGNGIAGDAAEVFEALKTASVPATLFVTGQWATANTDVVRGFHDAGYDVFNHSNTHASFEGLATSTIDSELTTADETISGITGTSTKPYFRPPSGDYDQTSITEARNQGYCTILWTVDSQDWKTDITVDEAVANVVDGLKNGAIIMLQANSDIGADLIAPLVNAVKERGYTFVALKELLRQTGDETTYTNTNVNRSSSSTSTNANANTNTSRNTNSNANS